MIRLDMTNNFHFQNRRRSSQMRTEGMQTLELSSDLEDMLRMMRRRLTSDIHLHMEYRWYHQLPSTCQQDMRSKRFRFHTFQKDNQLNEQIQEEI